MNTLSIIFLVIGVVAICTIVFLLVTCEFIYRFAIKRNSIVSRIVEKFFYRDIDKYKMDFSWWSGKNIEKYEIKSKDGLKLVGHFVPNITNKVALVVHGYGAKAMEMQTYCKMFFDLGYSVLAVDDRGHGESEGKNITMGYNDRYDISNWVDFIVSKNKHYKIVVFGLFMGAASVCLYSGLKKPRNVKAKKKM